MNGLKEGGGPTPDIKPAAMPSMPDVGSAAGLAAKLDSGPVGPGIKDLANVDTTRFLPSKADQAIQARDGAPAGGEGQVQGPEAGVVGQPGLNEASGAGGGDGGAPHVEAGIAEDPQQPGTGTENGTPVGDQGPQSEVQPSVADTPGAASGPESGQPPATSVEASVPQGQTDAGTQQESPAVAEPTDGSTASTESQSLTPDEMAQHKDEINAILDDSSLSPADRDAKIRALKNPTPDAGADANTPAKSAFEEAKDALRTRIAAGEKIESTGFNPVLEAVLAENAAAKNRSVDATSGTAPASADVAKPDDAAARTEAFKPGTRSEADVAKILGMPPPETSGSKPGEARTAGEIDDLLAPPGESPLDKPKDAATGAEAAKPVDAAAEPTAQPDVVDKATARQARMDELKGKIDANKADYNDLAEYQKLKSRPEDPAARMEELKSRAESGDMTDAEMNEYVSLKSEVNGEDGEGEEATAETSLDQQVEDMGTDLMEKMANGEAPTDEQVEEFQRLRTEQIVQQNGFSKEQSREAVKAMLEKKNGNERRRRKNTALENKIKELMTIDMQIMMIPKMLDKLREQRRPLIEKARQQHTTARTPENRAQEYQTLAQLGSINTAISEMKGQGLRLSTRRMVLEAAARRGTGVTGPIRSVVEFATAHVANIAVTIGTELAEDVEARTLTYAA